MLFVKLRMLARLQPRVHVCDGDVWICPIKNEFQQMICAYMFSSVKYPNEHYLKASGTVSYFFFFTDLKLLERYLSHSSDCVCGQSV